MTTAIIKTQTPDELEYARRIAGIETRKRQVADLQADLESLKLALSRFELEYRARVGSLLVEVDRLRLAIAEFRLRIDLLLSDREANPASLEADVASEFGARREEVRAEAEETRRYQRAYRQEQKRPSLAADTEAEIRRLYRELAKRFHPDLARAQDERGRRESIMLRINAAFRDRDLSGLRTLARETEREDPTFEERPLRDKLTWANQELARLDRVIAQLDGNLAVMRRSDTYRLWHTPEAATAAIARLQDNAQRKVNRLRDRLDETTLSYKKMINLRRRAANNERLRNPDGEPDVVGSRR